MASLQMSACQPVLRPTWLHRPVLAAQATTRLVMSVQFPVLVVPVVQRVPAELPVVAVEPVLSPLSAPLVLMDLKHHSWASSAHLVAVAVELLTWVWVATKVPAETVVVAVAPTELQ